jgi:hypoxanthine phosphoribosyltransferase
MLLRHEWLPESDLRGGGLNSTPVREAYEVEKRLLISREDIQTRVKELARRISLDYRGREPVFVGVLNGVIFFFADLLRQIEVPVKMDFVRAASYGSRTTTSGKVRTSKEVEIPIQGEPVILVEDIVDTGITLQHIVGALAKHSPESLRVCALIDKQERRQIGVPIDYCGFQVAEGFIVGYGLDYNEKYRNLLDLYTLQQTE